MLFTKIVAHALARHGLEVRGDAPFPRQLAPMLMHSAEALVASPDFAYEPKWDGFRVIATVRGRDPSSLRARASQHALDKALSGAPDMFFSFPLGGFRIS